MIQYNEKTIFLIGGDQNLATSNKTWIIDPTNGFKIKEGPSLNYARSKHGCAKMVVNGKTLLVVAGGIHGDKYKENPIENGIDQQEYSMHFTEILDPTSDEGWILGKKCGKPKILITLR